MSTLTLQASLPWTGSHEEDRRFRRILLQTLVILLAAGAITPYIRIPQPDSGTAEEMPPRRVRLLAMQASPVPGPAPQPAATAAAAATEPEPVPQSTPGKAPATPRLTPREKAASSGVLAMSDALARLRSTTPKTGIETGQDVVTSRGRAETGRASLLTTGVTRGSSGIEGGVAPQSVLGAAGLPGRGGSGQGSGSREVRVPGTGRAAAPAPVRTRSEEEIQEVLDRNKGAMYTLYNRELRKDASLQGKLVLSITIAPAGNVTRCDILSSELGAVSLEQQLVALVRRIDFGSKPGVPAVTTKIPIEFLPR
jgi:protein TonB